jgi:hypothetical protein
MEQHALILSKAEALRILSIIFLLPLGCFVIGCLLGHLFGLLL